VCRYADAAADFQLARALCPDNERLRLDYWLELSPHQAILVAPGAEPDFPILGLDEGAEL
jgi:hypothetical protein